jgi:glycosyltransferase involved in cell wall biosynthesis
MHRSVISVVIPAYNEEQTIGNVISDTITVMDSLGTPYEIIVVDDGSTDNTRQIASRYKAIVLSNGKNGGKGYALRKGFQHAQGDIIVTIDADGAHAPKEIPDLTYPLLNGVDMVSGSRFLGNGRKDSTSSLNRLGNFLFNTTIMALTGKHVSDSQTGFRAFKRDFLQKVILESCGYEIETEITVKGLKNGFNFQEKPISCERRKYNISKLKVLSDGTKILKTILKASFAKIQHDPKKGISTK